MLKLSLSDGGFKSLNMKRGMFRLWVIASVVWMFSVVAVNIDDAAYWFNYQFRYGHLVELTNEETATRIKVLEETGSLGLEEEYDVGLPLLSPDGVKPENVGPEERLNRALKLLKNTPPKPPLPSNIWLKVALLWPLAGLLLSPLLYWGFPFVFRVVIAPVLWAGRGFTKGRDE